MAFRTEGSVYSMRAGVRIGIIVFAAYAVTEYLLTSFPAWEMKPYFSIWHWGFNAFLFVIYFIVGMLSGGLCGILAHQLIHSNLLPKSVNRQALMLTMAEALLVAILAINILQRNSTSLRELAVISTLALFTVLPVRFPGLLLSKRHFTRVNFLLFALLLAALFINNMLEPGSKTALLAIAGVIWLSLTLLLARISTSQTQHGRTRSGSLVASNGSVLAATGLVTAILIMDLLNIHTQDELPTNGRTVSDQEHHPNVMLVVMDTVRADHLSVYGYDRDTTPNLSAFSRDATLYEQAISPGDMTLSTHGSLFTGLYGISHGAHYNDAGIGQPLDEGFTTVAEALSSDGYQTVGIISNHAFFDNGFGLEQGFDYIDARPADSFLIYRALTTSPLFIRATLHRKLSALMPATTTERHFRDADHITNEALRFIDSRQTTAQPFFLFINYMDAHWRYLPPTGFDTMYPGKLPDFDAADYYRLNSEITKTASRDITMEEREHLVSQYDGSIRYMDSRLQLIIDELKQTGMYDDMLIIITSDHGEAFGERQLVQHAVSAYQDQLHVPLLIRFPDGLHRGNVSDIVNTVSIMPTILAATGTQLPDKLDGENLATENPGFLNPVVGESFPNPNFLGKRFARTERAIYNSPYKFISSTNGKHELYNLETDPYESRNLYQENYAVAQQMEQSLEQWLQTKLNELAEIDNQELSPSARKRLKALGYIE